MSDLDFFESIQSFEQEFEKEVEQEKTSSKKKRKYKRKEESVDDADSNDIFFGLDYYPPGWIQLKQDDKILEPVDVVKIAKELKNKEPVSEFEKNIIVNLKLLRNCYCTEKQQLRLSKYFIRKIHLDPFYNPYAYTSLEEFADKDFKYLDGSSKDMDGFNIENWRKILKERNSSYFSVFANPPFDDLSKCADACNEFSLEKIKPSITFVANLDWTNYLKECFKYADYCIILGRVNYKPIMGLTNSSPRNSTIFLIYNSLMEIENNCNLILNGMQYYCMNLKFKKEIDLQQLELFGENDL